MWACLGPWLDCVEHYSGVARIASTFVTNGHCAQPFDVTRHMLFDNALTSEGLATQLLHTCHTKPLGLSWWGTVRSSWVWICRGTTLRSREDVLGRLDLQCVNEANTQVCRMALVLFLVISLRIHWVLEQPASSLMSLAPWLEFLNERLGLQFLRTSTWMCMFNASTFKPSALFSHSYFANGLARKRDASRDAEWRAVEGVNHLHPHPDGRQQLAGHVGLKTSQVYTQKNADEVFRMWSQKKDEPGGFPEDEADLLTEAFAPWIPLAKAF